MSETKEIIPIPECPKCSDWMDQYVGEDGKTYNICAGCNHKELNKTEE